VDFFTSNKTSLIADVTASLDINPLMVSSNNHSLYKLIKGAVSY